MIDYEFLDSGQGYKLERFGPFTIARPCGVALWDRTLPTKAWDNADAGFSRERENRWDKKSTFTEKWTIELAGVKMLCQATEFGHLGVFPEHAVFWPWMQKRARAFKMKHQKNLSVLNLFAYSGGATLALAKEGAEVCHLDSAKGMVDWAKKNAALNQLEEAKVRWIVDDALKFMLREIKRGKKYDAVILDPPSFGRGSKGEVFKIEDDVLKLLTTTKQLLSDKSDFVLFSCHTPGFTPLVMHNLMSSSFSGQIESGEMRLTPQKGYVLPAGTYGRWSVD